MMSQRTVTRADLVEEIISDLPVSKQQAINVLESMLTEISKTLSKGNSVKLSSFGTFSVRKKQERMGRNPRTGEEAVITPRQVISFRASPILRGSIGDKSK